MNFLETKNTNFLSPSNGDTKSVTFSDSDLETFLVNSHDGYYLNDSLHIFGLNKADDFHDINKRNEIIKQYFSYLDDIDSMFVFGEDIYTNHFICYRDGIGSLFIETGEIEHIADDFKQWQVMINSDPNYFSGAAILKDWEKENSKLDYNERLTPKIPFVSGGDIKPNNLYRSHFERVIDIQSDIACSVHSLFHSKPNI